MELVMMTGNEFSAALIMAGLTRKDFSEMSGLHERTIRKLCSGNGKIQKPVEEMVLRAVDDEWARFGNINIAINNAINYWHDRMVKAKRLVAEMKKPGYSSEQRLVRWKDRPAVTPRILLLAEREAEVAEIIWKKVREMEANTDKSIYRPNREMPDLKARSDNLMTEYTA